MPAPAMRTHRRTVIGREVELVNVLENAQRRGVLVDVDTPILLPDGRFEVTMSLLAAVETEEVPVRANRGRPNLTPARTSRTTARTPARAAAARRHTHGPRCRRTCTGRHWRVLKASARIAAVLAALGALAATGWALFLLTPSLLDSLPLLVGALALLAVLVIAVFGVTLNRCGGIHCPGCGHR